MRHEKTLDELLEGIRAVLAEDMKAKPVSRNKAVADPALWRAIQNQQKCDSERPCWFRGIAGKL